MGILASHVQESSVLIRTDCDEAMTKFKLSSKSSCLLLLVITLTLGVSPALRKTCSLFCLNYNFSKPWTGTTSPENLLSPYFYLAIACSFVFILFEEKEMSLLSLVSMVYRLESN